MLAVYLATFFILSMFIFGVICFIQAFRKKLDVYLHTAIILFVIDAVMLIAGLHFGLE